MGDYVLVLNAGSSSLKFSVYRRSDSQALELDARGQIDGIGTAPRFTAKQGDGGVAIKNEGLNAAVRDAPSALEHLAGWLRSRYAGAQVLGVGHRVVHGGSRYTQPVLVTPAVLDDLRELVPLAPLHQPHNLAAIEAVSERLQGVPQVACFDTSFHRAQPAVAELVPLPRDLCANGIQRYGFHGLSYEYVASMLPKAAPEIAAGRVIVAHLGSGASLCALDKGKSIDSTLGFTALDGLCMGTRPGALDPGVVLYLFQVMGKSAAEVEKILYKESGLLGISGISNDMRDLLGNPAPEAQARGGLLRLPRGTGDRRADRCSRGYRRTGVHRRDRGERSRGAAPHLRGVRVARCAAGSRRQPPRRRAHLGCRQPRVGVGYSDERRADDRPPHQPRAGARRSGNLNRERRSTAMDSDGVIGDGFWRGDGVALVRVSASASGTRRSTSAISSRRIISPTTATSDSSRRPPAERRNSGTR